MKTSSSIYFSGCLSCLQMDVVSLKWAWPKIFTRALHVIICFSTPLVQVLDPPPELHVNASFQVFKNHFYAKQGSRICIIIGQNCDS